MHRARIRILDRLIRRQNVEETVYLFDLNVELGLFVVRVARLSCLLRLVFLSNVFHRLDNNERSIIVGVSPSIRFFHLVNAISWLLHPSQTVLMRVALWVRCLLHSNHEVGHRAQLSRLLVTDDSDVGHEALAARSSARALRSLVIGSFRFLFLRIGLFLLNRLLKNAFLFPSFLLFFHFILRLGVNVFKHGDETGFAHEATNALFFTAIRRTTMPTSHHHLVALRPYMIVVQDVLILLQLDLQKLAENGPLETKELHEMVLVSR